jgi:hypothetical protein
MKVGRWMAVGLIAAALPAYAEESAGSPQAAPASPATVIPGAVVTDLVTIQAKVLAIDLADRKVTLEKPNGRKVTLTVDKSAVNLPQVKVGDIVQMDYLESVAISVVGPGETPEAEGGGMVAVAPRGQKPGGIVAHSVQVTAQILKIKAKQRKVLLKWPDGTTKWIKAGPAVKHFDRLKVNDQVVVTYTEAVAIDVKPPAPKSS